MEKLLKLSLDANKTFLTFQDCDISKSWLEIDLNMAFMINPFSQKSKQITIKNKKIKFATICEKKSIEQVYQIHNDSIIIGQDQIPFRQYFEKKKKIQPNQRKQKAQEKKQYNIIKSPHKQNLPRQNIFEQQQSPIIFYKPLHNFPFRKKSFSLKFLNQKYKKIRTNYQQLQKNHFNSQNSPARIHSIENKQLQIHRISRGDSNHQNVNTSQQKLKKVFSLDSKIREATIGNNIKSYKENTENANLNKPELVLLKESKRLLAMCNLRRQKSTHFLNKCLSLDKKKGYIITGNQVIRREISEKKQNYKMTEATAIFGVKHILNSIPLNRKSSGSFKLQIIPNKLLIVRQ